MKPVDLVDVLSSNLPETLSKAAACYLYSYFKKSYAAGLFLSMDNTYDSILTAYTVYLMCQMLVE